MALTLSTLLSSQDSLTHRTGTSIPAWGNSTNFSARCLGSQLPLCLAPRPRDDRRGHRRDRTSRWVGVCPEAVRRSLTDVPFPSGLGQRYTSGCGTQVLLAWLNLSGWRPESLRTRCPQPQSRVGRGSEDTRAAPPWIRPAAGGGQGVPAQPLPSRRRAVGVTPGGWSAVGPWVSPARAPHAQERPDPVP